MMQAACTGEELGGAWTAAGAPAAYVADADGLLKEDADANADWCAWS